MATLPHSLAKEVRETRQGLSELVGRLSGIMRTLPRESPLYADLQGAYVEFCGVLASANAAESSVSALIMTGQIERHQDTCAPALPLHPRHYEARQVDRKMAAAGDHTLDD